MSSSTSTSGARRKSKSGLFNRSTQGLSPLTAITASADSSSMDKMAPKTLKKKRSTGNRLASAFAPTDNRRRAFANGKAQAGFFGGSGGSRPPSSGPSDSPASSESPRSSRPSFGKRGRPSSIFGSLRSLRFGDDDDNTPPQTATSVSSQDPTGAWKDFAKDIVEIGRNNVILHHGEAQTSSGWFWKKREYLVLTEGHLIRYKNRAKANEAFPSIPLFPSRHDLLRHASSRSIDSSLDQQSVSSDISGDKAAGIPLESVVAVYVPDESRSTVEVSYLDTETGHGSSITLLLSDSEDRDLWLRSIREAANRASLLDSDPVPMKLLEYVSRVVEREQDYDPANIKIYKIAKRAAYRSNGRSSADDSAKTAAVVCFLVIGINKVHIIPLPKNSARNSTSSLGELGDVGSFGILTLTWISVSSNDDSFALAFRFPCQAPNAFSVASLASSEIAVQLRERDSYLRPEWLRRPFGFSIPARVEDVAVSSPEPGTEDLNCFERTLTAFCVAYGVNPNKICYSVNYFAEDAPQFDLLTPVQRNQRGYTAPELLAVLRALRYNEYFKSISFAYVELDVLKGLRDYHGVEHLCTHTKTGAGIRIDREEMENASLLVSEIRAIAVSSRTLRRLNFSYSIVSSGMVSSRSGPSESSCEVLEALYPLCRDQVTNVDWICLNGIPLSEADLEYLVSIAADRSCHLRAVELSNCGISGQNTSLILDTLRAQSETLEAIDISSNPSRLLPVDLSMYLEAFNYIRKLNLSNTTLASNIETFLPFEVLSKWRLEELKLHGVPLNDRSVQTICRYATSPKSESLRELILSNCSLSGRQAWDLMYTLTLEAGTARLVHLDISENNFYDGHDHIVRAIARNLAPTHLSLRSLEYENDHKFAELIFALAQNKSIRYLDLARVSLPGEASPETCTAFEELFMQNATLEDLDISGEVSRLEITKFGTGLIQALKGLRQNKTLQTLKIQYQKLGLPGASALADILRENKTLKHLHCECNNITLSGFTDLVNALAYNRTLLYLPSLEEGRAEALKQTEAQIKIARNRPDTTISPSKLSGVRKTFAKIGTGDGSASGGGPRIGSVPQWSEQDAQAALRLVDEGWEGQMVRLQAFLNRNNKLAAGVPLDEPDGITEEELLRPGTAGSISKILERVTIESTPTVEKFAELSNEQRNENPVSDAAAPTTTSGYLAPPMVSPSGSHTSSILGNVEIDTTPMFEKDDPFRSTAQSRHVQSSTVTKETTTSAAFPSSPTESSNIELRLPPTKSKN